MIRHASLFSQLLSLFPRQEFQRAVTGHGAERYAKGFPSWDQFVAMLFCQLAQAKSLREICGGLRCCLGKLVHLGVSKAPPRSTLAYANEHRPWQLYDTVLKQLVARCQQLNLKRKWRFRNKIFSLDSTVILLSLSLFDWAKYRPKKGAVKLHLLLDHDGYFPVFAHLDIGQVHDVNIARGMDFPADSILVVDRGYYAFGLFARWTRQGVYFVTRIKTRTRYRVVERRTPPRGVLQDQIIQLTGTHARRDCPFRLRRVVYRDPDSGKVLEFLTNQFDFGATTIARIYKDRWQIELFFKALKQNLKIKSFIGTTPNALMTQIWTALIALVLLKYLQLRSKLNWALSNLVAFLRWNLFSYRDLWDWLDDPYRTPPLGPPVQQLSLALPGVGQQRGGPGL
jgi:hypothetical protein